MAKKQYEAVDYVQTGRNEGFARGEVFEMDEKHGDALVKSGAAVEYKAPEVKKPKGGKSDKTDEL